MNRSIRCVALLAVVASFCSTCIAEDKLPTVRFATFNVSLNRKSEGQLADDLARSNSQAIKVAEIIQRVRPDVILLNEFDYDERGKSVSQFVTHYLGVGQGQQQPIEYAYQFSAPVNTGVPSGRDLNNDGKLNGPADAWGYGVFPGQYGMVVLSRFPFDEKNVRTFQKFLWKDMPNADRPIDPTSKVSFYSDEDWQQLRLSSKSHWDLPIRTDRGLIHFLVSHPTPPAFDGPEDRNGCRNHDEIRLWADYVTPSKSGYIYDDKGRRGGLRTDASFVIAGDLNADPKDGASRNNAIRQLLASPRVRDRQPKNPTGRLQSEQDARVNLKHTGNPEFDTANFSDRVAGNLRVDYVLPSANLPMGGNAGIFWPDKGEPGSELVGCSDHRLVWIDISD
ncbi:MAG: endonuclease/exonuclease/phosphatase family protein [Planctomycetaceae bacterium]